MMNRKTKIVCTLGPAVASKEMIEKLIYAGVNVARINCSHGEWELRSQWIKWIRELNSKIAPVGILVDLQGPKFRLGEVKNDFFKVEIGQLVSISNSENTDICIPDKIIYDAIEVGGRILLGDGEVELKVNEKKGELFLAIVVSGGEIKSRKGITLLGKSFAVPALTDKDFIDLQHAVDHGVDFIALSYVRSAEDIIQLRNLVSEHDPNIKICAKIECKEALDKLDSILEVSDVIMVARGDLGLQMDFEDVPIAQKQIIAKSALAGRPVITATQMLESMVHSSRPTRAEATDVTNAIFDGTDAIMLSQETAAGNYPLEAVRTMARIAERAETVYKYQAHIKGLEDNALPSTEAVAEAVVTLAASINAKAIITTTTSGYTSLMVSKYRPKVPIYCATWNPYTQEQMSVVWGVDAMHIPVPENTDQSITYAMDAFTRCGYLRAGDTVVITAGIPVGTPGVTNLIMVQTIK